VREFGSEGFEDATGYEGVGERVVGEGEAGRGKSVGGERKTAIYMK
jgi:hypothetical protein